MEHLAHEDSQGCPTGAELGRHRIEQQDRMPPSLQQPGAGKSDDARSHHDDLP